MAVTVSVLKIPGGIRRFISFFGCNSLADALHTSSSLRFKFSSTRQSFIRASSCASIGLLTSSCSATVSFQSVINWLMMYFVEVLTVTV